MGFSSIGYRTLRPTSAANWSAGVEAIHKRRSSSTAQRKGWTVADPSATDAASVELRIREIFLWFHIFIRPVKVERGIQSSDWFSPLDGDDFICCWLHLFLFSWFHWKKVFHQIHPTCPRTSLAVLGENVTSDVWRHCDDAGLSLDRPNVPGRFRNQRRVWVCGL